MSVLASQVITRLNALFSDTSNSKWSEAEKLEAVNAAIDGAWPHIRALAADVTQTIASTTYEYSPSATPEVEAGFAQAYATRTGWGDTLLRQVSQEQSGTTFTIHLSEAEAANYSGWTLRLVYTTRLARVDETTDTIELPLDYLYKAAAVHLMVNKVIDESKADVGAYEKLLVKFERDVEKALIQNQRGLIAPLIPWVTAGSNVRGSLTSGEHA
jgi:hypothetical protein